MTIAHWPSNNDLISPRADERFVLRLYITGTTPRSAAAVVNVRRICDEHLEGRYDLEVIDVLRHPEEAVKEQIVAAPTLVKHLPHPVRRFIGDMSQTERLLSGLGLNSATYT